MIGIGSAVTFAPGSRHEFSGYVVALNPSGARGPIARIVSPTLSENRRRESRDIGVTELIEVAAPPLDIPVGAMHWIELYGFKKVRVLSRNEIAPGTFEALVFEDRESGVRFRRYWSAVPEWHYRLGY